MRHSPGLRECGTACRPGQEGRAGTEGAGRELARWPEPVPSWEMAWGTVCLSPGSLSNVPSISLQIPAQNGAVQGTSGARGFARL